MAIEFRKATPDESRRGTIAVADIPKGAKVTREDLNAAVAKLMEPAPLGSVTIPVSASVAKSKVVKQLEADGNVKVLGRPPTGAAKKAVTIRLDQDVVKALGTREGWRSEINAVLRRHLGLL